MNPPALTHPRLSQQDFDLIARVLPTQKPAAAKLPLCIARRRVTRVSRGWRAEHFYSDKSRIVFSSSFRRMMQKAQVFSLEVNTSVRNRLTHTLEVADVGRTLARHVGKALESKGLATADDTECIQSIVENACLLHDIGNPPFGHFGEKAIQAWFATRGLKVFSSICEQLPLRLPEALSDRLNDFLSFDGNPQGFRIVTRLHCEFDDHGLNLTGSTLLAGIKYPPSGRFGKKLGVFSSERKVYQDVCALCGALPGQRYFLAYLMELADDICYCLSDIADAIEKDLITLHDFRREIRKLCKAECLSFSKLFADSTKNTSSSANMAIFITRLLVDEAATHIAKRLDNYLDGSAGELAEDLPSGKVLKCIKGYARRFIYTDPEVHRIEIAGSRIVEGLLDHFGRLLEVPREDFEHFVTRGELRKRSGLDTEWRIFNQLSKRMLKVYKKAALDAPKEEEWLHRARLIVDYISGLTDTHALRVYQNFMGISLGSNYR